MIDHLGDVAKAIEFVEREGDERIFWTELIAGASLTQSL